MKKLNALALVIAATMASSAWAGRGSVADADDDETPAQLGGAEPDENVKPEPVPVVAPVKKTKGNTDFDGTLDDWGVQLTMDGGLVVPVAGVTHLPLLGVRKWGSTDGGWELGAGMAFIGTGGDPGTTDVAFGAGIGLLRTIGIYRHLITFWEPSAGLFISAPDGGDTSFGFVARGSLGAEVRLGMMGLSRVGVTTRFSLGLAIANDGSKTDIAFATDGGAANSVRGLAEASVGFVVYL